MKLALIDADGLCYHSLRETLEDSLTALDEKIQNIFEKTECTHYCMFVSKGKYFRYSIDPLYKANRTYKAKNPWSKTLKEVLIAKYGATYMPEVEADDLISYFYNVPKIIHTVGHGESLEVEDALFNSRVPRIICSPDKDVLQGIAGKHFNYSYKLEDKDNPESVVKGWWVETTDDEMQLNFWNSMVTGDTTDGIKGIEGKGIAFANKIYDVESVSLQYICLREYISKYGLSQGIFEFQKNFRLLHLLTTDEDFLREVGKLPEYPKVIEVIRDSQIAKEPKIDF